MRSRFTYEDLGNALRKIRIDLKIPIEFDESLNLLRDRKTRFAVATIRYSALDEALKDGILLYIKPIMLGNEPPDVTAYQAANETFPHQSNQRSMVRRIANESYRMLGVHTVNEICGPWDSLSGLLDHLCAVHRSEPSGRGASVGTALRVL